MPPYISNVVYNTADALVYKKEKKRLPLVTSRYKMATHSRNGRMKINISQEMIDQVCSSDDVIIESLTECFPDDKEEQAAFIQELRDAIQYGDGKLLGEVFMPRISAYIESVVQYRMDRGDFDRDWWQNPESDRE